MAEKKAIITGLKLKYEGLFDLKELYHVMERWFKEMGYDKDDYGHEYKVFEDSKVLNLDIRPYRSVSEYVKLMMIIKITCANLKDVVVKIDGKDTKLQDGDVTFVFNGYVISDYEKRWVANAFSYFLRVIIDKYLYSGYMRDFEGLCKEDVSSIYTELSAYLNINKYRFGEK